MPGHTSHSQGRPEIVHYEKRWEWGEGESRGKQRGDSHDPATRGS